MNELQKQLEAEFRAKAYIILQEFQWNGMKYVLYRLNQNHSGVFLTGDQFNWMFGLQWSKSMRAAVEVYRVEEDVRLNIESYLRTR